MVYHWYNGEKENGRTKKEICRDVAFFRGRKRNARRRRAGAGILDPQRVGEIHAPEFRQAESAALACSCGLSSHALRRFNGKGFDKDFSPLRQPEFFLASERDHLRIIEIDNSLEGVKDGPGAFVQIGPRYFVDENFRRGTRFSEIK